MSAKSRIYNEYNERGNCSDSSDALKLEYKRLSLWLRRKSICSFVITIFSLESKPASREKEILRNINNSYSSGLVYPFARYETLRNTRLPLSFVSCERLSLTQETSYLEEDRNFNLSFYSQAREKWWARSAGKSIEEVQRRRRVRDKISSNGCARIATNCCIKGWANMSCLYLLTPWREAHLRFDWHGRKHGWMKRGDSRISHSRHRSCNHRARELWSVTADCKFITGENAFRNKSIVCV